MSRAHFRSAASSPTDTSLPRQAGTSGGGRGTPDLRKPLYLDGRTTEIRIRALGPALGIDSGARRFSLPVARLSRIVVRGRVTWDSGAIGLCLCHRVPIVFSDGRGRPIGSAAPLSGRTSTLHELLVDWLDCPDWRSSYENWRRSQRLDVLRCWRAERERRGHPIDVRAWQEAVRSFVYLGQSSFASPEPSACCALVVALILRAGLRLQYRALDGGSLALADDLAQLVDRKIALEGGSMAMAFGGCSVLAARAIEGASADLEKFVENLLSRLRRHVAESIEPWP